MRAAVALVSLFALSSLGLHCGERVYRGPQIEQRHRGRLEGPLHLRITRKDGDFKSAEIIVGTPDAQFRSCDGTPLEATSPGRLVLRDRCVEVLVAAPAQPWDLELRIVSDIGREVLIDRNCSPHDSHGCDDPLDPKHTSHAWAHEGVRVGLDEEEAWRSWTIEVIEAAP